MEGPCDTLTPVGLAEVFDELIVFIPFIDGILTQHQK